MKKLLKLFGLLIAMGTLFCLSSCDSLLNGSEPKDETPVVDYTFYLSDDKVSYQYFSGTTQFSYTDSDGVKHDDCIYQVSFTPKTSNTGKWMMYIRPKSSTTTVETKFKGTYEGNVKQEGQVKLLNEDGQLNRNITIEYKEIQLTNSKKTTYVFTTDVGEVHKYYGCSNAK